MVYYLNNKNLYCLKHKIKILMKINLLLNQEKKDPISKMEL